ncbi:MAG: hypothetical protein KH405_07230 [Firmicutes bacterium]|jgi:sporulation initiation factor Spo0A C-terminal domain protein|nr:hypothetical protein [Bacillota bacterium]
MLSVKEKHLINKMLIKRRILPNKKGYAYLFCVIERLLNNKTCLSDAYFCAADKFKVKANTVEKSISNAIEGSFDNMFVAERYGSFASPDSGKITNKKFISLIIDEIHNCEK